MPRPRAKVKRADGNLKKKRFMSVFLSSETVDGQPTGRSFLRVEREGVTALAEKINMGGQVRTARGSGWPFVTRLCLLTKGRPLPRAVLTFITRAPAPCGRRAGRGRWPGGTRVRSGWNSCSRRVRRP